MEFNRLNDEEKKLFYGETIYTFDVLPLDDSSSDSYLQKLGLIQNAPTLGNAFDLNPNKFRLNRFVISHNNRYKTFWDMLLMLFVIYSSFSTSYVLAFDISGPEMSNFDILEGIVEVCFYIDLFLTFFHEYRDSQSFECISDVRLIAKNYLKPIISCRSWFIVDLLAVLPFERLGYDPFLRLLRILRLPRLLRFMDYSRIDKLLHSLLENTNSKKRTDYIFYCKYAYKVIRLILIATILTYFLGCLWYAIVSSSWPGEGTGFYSSNELYKYDNLRRLIICCYFVLTTLTTVGYGDMLPISHIEKSLSIVVMILGIALFSYVIGSFNDVVSAYERKMGVTDQTLELGNWLRSLSRFTDNQLLPKELVKKIDEHFKFFWKSHRLLNLSRDDPYFARMPKSLQYRLIYYMFDDVFSLFRGFFHINEFKDSPFYYELAYEFLPCKFDIGEKILKPGQPVNEIYLIKEGSVCIYMEHEGKTLAKYFSRGYVFGAYNVFFNTPAKFYYKAVKGADTCTKVISISKSKLLKLLRDYPQIFARMAQNAQANDRSLKNMMKQEIKQMLLDLKKPFTQEDVDKILRDSIPKPKIGLASKNTITLDKNKIQELKRQLQVRERKINKKLNEVKKFGNMLGGDLDGVLSQLRKVKDKLSRNKSPSKCAF